MRKALRLIFIAALLLYGTGSFYSVSLDIASWSDTTRGNISTLFMGCMFAITSLTYLGQGGKSDEY